mmetsp:Transcript_44380/g.82881  ORF Transcript_44380/g.82881 Transcript_44380/m.82881 type:complete len:495 (-) Transcript_44380:102-1586(-)
MEYRYVPHSSGIMRTREIHRHTGLQLLRELLLENEFVHAAESSPVLASMGAAFKSGREFKGGLAFEFSTGRTRAHVTSITEIDALQVSLELMFRANHSSCEQDCTIGASGCGVGHMKTTLHLRVLIDHLSPFTSRREELLQQLVIYHLMQAQDPISSLDSLEPEILEKGSNAFRPVRMIARSFLLHSFWAQALSKLVPGVHHSRKPTRVQESVRLFARYMMFGGSPMKVSSSRRADDFCCQAIRTFQSVQQHIQHDVLVVCCMAQLYASYGQHDEALSFLKITKDAAPQSADMHTLQTIWLESTPFPDEDHAQTLLSDILRTCYLSVLQKDISSAHALRGMFLLGNIGRCSNKVLAERLTAHLDVCHFNTPRAWQHLAELLPKLSRETCKSLAHNRQWWARCHFTTEPGSDISWLSAYATAKLATPNNDSCAPVSFGEKVTMTLRRQVVSELEYRFVCVKYMVHDDNVRRRIMRSIYKKLCDAMNAIRAYQSHS